MTPGSERRIALSLSPKPGEPPALLVDRARTGERLGYESVWLSQRADMADAPTVLTACAAATSGIGLATAVLPIYGRHPVAMAQMALTLDELSGGRFRLGIGVSHPSTVEQVWRLRMPPAIPSLRDYLTIVRQATAEGSVFHEGPWFSATWAYDGGPRPRLPIVLGAVNPRSLTLAGELADGVVLWLCTPDYLASHVIPNLAAGRARRGLDMAGFDVAAMIGATLTDDREAAIRGHRAMLASYVRLPSYGPMLRRSGFGRQVDAGHVDRVMVEALAAIGRESALSDRVECYRQAGCTLPVLSPHCGPEFASDWQRTVESMAPASPDRG